MHSHYSINLNLNVLPLQERLKKHPELFGRYPMRGEGESPHREMTDIWVRYNDIAPFLKSGDFSAFADEHDSVWYPVVDEIPEALPLIFDVMTKVKGERLGGVLITKLPSGGQIKPHIDSGWHAAYYDKYYVPIENYSGATFEFEDGTIEPDFGEVYWFDNSKQHWVNNKSCGERIAMIICIRGTL